MGRPGKWVKYYTRVVFIFSFFCDPNFLPASRDKTAKTILTLLDSYRHKFTTSVRGYCIPKKIKLQNVSAIPILLQKHPKRGVNKHFQSKLV